jgi:hypothetical protein
MKAIINVEQELYLSDIMIGEKSISVILSDLHKKISRCVMDISIESQSDNPNYTDIDSPLHSALSEIEKLLGNS